MDCLTQNVTMGSAWNNNCSSIQSNNAVYNKTDLTGQGSTPGCVPSPTRKAIETRREMEQRKRVLALSTILLIFLKRVDILKFKQCREALVLCRERYRSKLSGYESFALAVERDLRHVAGDEKWKIAEFHLTKVKVEHLIRQFSSTV
jgi:hypothetical protein